MSNKLRTMNIALPSYHLKYIGISLSLGYALYRLQCYLREKKRRNALRGQVVVVTGASSGIGEALAHVFHESGCKVVLASRRISELERVKQNLLSKKQLTSTHEPFVIELDLENLDQLETFVSKVHDKFGHIDILINNGGISHRGTILGTKLQVDKKIMFTNYFGTVGLTKAALPKMVERKSGYIVFISSVQGLLAIPDRSAYAASKHALQAFGDCLRSEMAQHNLKVSVVSPGYVKTSVSLNAISGDGSTHGEMDKSTESGFSAEYVAKEILTMIVNEEKELIISQFLPKLGVFLRHNIPSAYHYLMSKRAVKTT